MGGWVSMGGLSRTRSKQTFRGFLPSIFIVDITSISFDSPLSRLHFVMNYLSLEAINGAHLLLCSQSVCEVKVR